MSDYGEAAAYVNSQPPPESVKEPVTKVKKQLPQKSVDDFWEKFTTKFPGKVHTVLPANVYAKTKASKTDKGIVGGQGAGKSYEQAACECKHAVEKIAKECRRVNHKDRDPHFDIEFDLKRNRRDCLDGLEEIEEKDTAYPRSVKRVTDIFEKPEFYQEGITATDVRQGNSGDCWFLSALCALSNKRGLVEKVCVARDEVVGVYGFVFHRDGEWIQTIIDDKLYLIASDWWESSDDEKRTFEAVNRSDAEEKYRQTNQTGSKSLFFAQCSSENETWLPLLEKAFAKAHGDFSAIDGGFTGEAIEDLTGGVTTELFTTDILDKDKFWTEEIIKVNEEFLFSCATGTFDKWQDSDVASMVGARGNIVRMHAYSIMEAREVKGQRLLRVRNPWGESEWRGAWSDGSGEWTPEWMQLLDHKFGDDGMFWISYEDILRKYSSFDRTRLFGPDWNITQQWTTVDVPWSADYNDTKFTITVAKPGPIVIVLSQLDDRYFKGLEGQYAFQLHFRLEKDGDHDYIVRSHGNYFMRRSVSTDLELEPGTYSVLMKITATRRTGDSTPEEIIRANCKSRQNKLIQIGLAYDLAHAKGQIRETEIEKQERQEREEKKKAAERKKKREAIRQGKFKEWDYNKKLKSRDRRHTKKREEYERKKAERKAAKQPEVTGKDDVGDADADAAPTANGAKVEKEAAAGATEDKAAEPAPESSSMPSPPAEGAEEEWEDEKEEPETAASKATVAANKSKNFEVALQNVPSVTVNGAPIPASTAPPPSQPAESVAAPSTLAPNDDYQYDSDASFVSSIDSVLDARYAAEDQAAAVEDRLPAATGDDDENAEFENDPWNAVCVVGLRVYSKSDGCSVEVVRPKHELDVEDTPLDLDDASKGASGEVEGAPVNGVKVKVEVDTSGVKG